MYSSSWPVDLRSSRTLARVDKTATHTEVAALSEWEGSLGHGNSLEEAPKAHCRSSCVGPGPHRTVAAAEGDEVSGDDVVLTLGCLPHVQSNSAGDGPQ